MALSESGFLRENSCEQVINDRIQEFVVPIACRQVAFYGSDQSNQVTSSLSETRQSVMMMRIRRPSNRFETRFGSISAAAQTFSLNEVARPQRLELGFRRFLG